MLSSFLLSFFLTVGDRHQFRYEPSTTPSAPRSPSSGGTRRATTSLRENTDHHKQSWDTSRQSMQGRTDRSSIQTRSVNSGPVYATLYQYIPLYMHNCLRCQEENFMYVSLKLKHWTERNKTLMYTCAAAPMPEVAWNTGTSIRITTAHTVCQRTISNFNGR
jgi:hypothetical protein